MLSKASQYAIKALLFIGANLNEEVRANVKDIALAIDSPPAFTSKILQQLVAAKIITSVKGSGGGFEISVVKMKSTTILSVLIALEGDHFTSSCFLGLAECSDRNPCPIHTYYAPIREKMNKELFSNSIYDLINTKSKKYLHLKG